jgi:hypothetical protein
MGAGFSSLFSSLPLLKGDRMQDYRDTPEWKDTYTYAWVSAGRALNELMYEIAKTYKLDVIVRKLANGLKRNSK